MTEFLYSTPLDGMKTILTSESISDGDYVYIHDKLFKGEVTLFKNKETKGQDVDLKTVKLADIMVLTEEEQSNYKWNQLYSFEGTVFTSTNRLNKNQLIAINNSFYAVEDITKHQDKPLEPSLALIPFKSADNIYRILQTSKQTGKTSVHSRYTDYGEALISLSRLREKRDENFYRFP